MSATSDRIERLTDQRRMLLERWRRDGAPGEPLGPVAAALLAVWEETLETAVGPDDDFFDLGGDSVLAVIVAARAADEGIELTTQELFDHPTVRRLAAVAREAPAPSLAGPDRLALGSSHPVTPLQDAMLFHVADAPGSYVSQVRARLRGPLDLDAWQQAWTSAVGRHEALAMGFRPGAGGWQQVVGSVDPPPVEVVDAVGRDGDAIADAVVARHLQMGFALDRPPLVRMAVIRVAQDEHVVVWSHHHLVLDGWSQQIVIDDLLRAYHTEQRGAGATPMPARCLAPYLAWLASPGPTDDEAHWRAHLAGARLLPPSAARRRPHLVRLEVPHDLATRARRQGLTLATVVVGAWAAALAHHQVTDDLVVGVTVSGRPAEVDGSTDLVGSFVNTLPLRVRPPARGDARAWLADVQTTLARNQRSSRARLAEIRRWAGLAQDGMLFDSIVVVESFPTRVETAARDAGLELLDVVADIDERLPLVLEVTPGPPVVLRCRYDPDRFRSVDVRRLLAGASVAAAALAIGDDLEGVGDRIRRAVAEVPDAERDDRVARLGDCRPRRRLVTGDRDQEQEQEQEQEGT